MVLFETAALRSAYLSPGTKAHGDRIERILRLRLNIDPTERVEEKPKEEPKETTNDTTENTEQEEMDAETDEEELETAEKCTAEKDEL